MFNIRVYGILINAANEILLSDELIRGSYYTKFPGGGLELGEGTRDCLKREFMEEMNLQIETGKHIYTTDYYQQSAFNPADQIISIYYQVNPLEEIRVPMSNSKFAFTDQQLSIYEKTASIETFRFVHLNEFSEADVTLPIDKIVATMILQNR
jgi:8-oxo-dGTP diphosphatase